MAPYSGGSTGGGHAGTKTVLNFMQFWEFWQNHMLASRRVGALSYGESWIRPCLIWALFKDFLRFKWKQLKTRNKDEFGVIDPFRVLFVLVSSLYHVGRISFKFTQELCERSERRS